MSANYIIRFDDICPTMRWDMWDRIEAILDKHSVQPLMAIVPDNRDPNLEIDKPKQDFWFRVRIWREKYWSIGLHGYQHLYVTKERGFYGRIDQSEFAGLPVDEQEAKLRKAMVIFHREGIEPAAWVAPGNSFDRSTLVGLKKIGLKVISDGFFFGPRIDNEGFIWVPQQLGKPRAMAFGIWTISLHHNSWTERDLAAFEAFLARYHRAVMGLDMILDGVWPNYCALEDKVLTGIRTCIRGMRTAKA